MTTTLPLARSRSADELALAVLPRLFARLDARTDELTALTRRIDRRPERTLADEQALSALARANTEIHGLGWCLGVLAAASGVDLLLARRERDGLARLARLVEEALARCPLVPPASALPRLSTTVGEGWELPFLLAVVMLHAGASLPADAPLRWDLAAVDAGVHLRWSAPAASPEVVERVTRLAELVPGTTIRVADGSWVIRLPSAAIERSATNTLP